MYATVAHNNTEAKACDACWQCALVAMQSASDVQYSRYAACMHTVCEPLLTYVQFHADFMQEARMT